MIDITKPLAGTYGKLPGLVCNYNIKGSIFCFFSRELDRAFICNSEGQKVSTPTKCLQWEHTNNALKCNEIPKIAFEAADRYFATLMLTSTDSNYASLMKAWQSISS